MFPCCNSRCPHTHGQGDHPEGLRDLSQVPGKEVAQWDLPPGSLASESRQLMSGFLKPESETTALSVWVSDLRS